MKNEIREQSDERVERIVNDREHGSRWLVREAMLLLHDLAGELANDSNVSEEEAMGEMRLVGQRLASARPAMAALAGAVRHILKATGGLRGMEEEVSRLLESYEHATERMAVFARNMLTGTVMTHSMSGTVVDVLVECKEQIERVIVLEGRPRYEGRVMAEVLAKKGIEVTLITDAQADIFLAQCTAVVVGADTIFANGDVLNKAGTALLAWAAQGHTVAFYVLSETLKVSPHIWEGDEGQLEEKEAEEVMETPPEGIKVRNFYFDRTPAYLVTKVITEQGVMGAIEVQHIADTLPPLLFTA